MKKIITLLAAGTCLTGSSFYANAVSVPFRATVEGACSLVLEREGILAVGSSGRSLSTKAAGGQSAQVNVTASDPAFKVSVTNPGTFDTAPAGFTNTAAALDFDTNSTYLDPNVTNDVQNNVRRGVDNINPIQVVIGTYPHYIDQVARLGSTTNSGGFISGDYVSTVTVTCESFDTGVDCLDEANLGSSDCGIIRSRPAPAPVPAT